MASKHQVSWVFVEANCTECLNVFVLVVNYALQQPAKQYYGTGFGRVAARAVDGNRDTSQQSLTCTHTSASPTFHWWKVDLGKNSLVYAVAVTNRATAGGRLKDFEIFVSPSEKVVEERGATCDGRQGVDEGATRAIFCKQPLRGRYVAIVSRLQEVLTFCEVYVQAWEDGKSVTRTMVAFYQNASRVSSKND